MNNVIRNFLYLDSDFLYSLYAQAFGGVEEKVFQGRSVMVGSEEKEGEETRARRAV